MEHTSTFIALDAIQADNINRKFNLSFYSNNNYYQGCDIEVEYCYEISDEPSDTISVELYDIFLIHDKQRFQIDLTHKQLQSLKDHATEISSQIYEPFYHEDEQYFS